MRVKARYNDKRAGMDPRDIPEEEGARFIFTCLQKGNIEKFHTGESTMKET